MNRSSENLYGDMVRLHDQYLREIEPIIQERTKLYGMLSDVLMILHEDGHIEVIYSEEVKKLDEAYVKLTKQIQEHIFGGENRIRLSHD